MNIQPQCTLRSILFPLFMRVLSARGIYSVQSFMLNVLTIFFLVKGCVTNSFVLSKKCNKGISQHLIKQLPKFMYQHVIKMNAEIAVFVLHKWFCRIIKEQMVHFTCMIDRWMHIYLRMCVAKLHSMYLHQQDIIKHTLHISLDRT